ncbi:hypothetical protein [Rhodopseudomonas sp. B29]|uniref:hypothetical protein n=1 Tax=Rhodopseudomonas sp. B29 TaxID=95607 RepID=UPI0003492678|nr:hypothetical protein [Rhodopseudomonas sp. B29]
MLTLPHRAASRAQLDKRPRVTSLVLFVFVVKIAVDAWKRRRRERGAGSETI